MQDTSFVVCSQTGAVTGVVTTNEETGELRIEGPNRSQAVTIDKLDRVQIGPRTDGNAFRLRVNEGDTHLDGHAWVGPYFEGGTQDPDGALTLHRNIAAQLATFMRIYRGQLEQGRLGLNPKDEVTFMRGPWDDPALTVTRRRSVQLYEHQPTVEVTGGELAIEDGSLVFYKLDGSRHVLVP